MLGVSLENVGLFVGLNVEVCACVGLVDDVGMLEGLAVEG